MYTLEEIEAIQGIPISGIDIVWYIPKEIFDAFTYDVKEQFDAYNQLVPYRISAGTGKTWIKTETFGWFYACKVDKNLIPTLAALVPGLPGMIQDWKLRESAKRKLITT